MMHRSKMANKLFWILILIFFSAEGLAQIQPFLLLQKPGNINKRIRYYPGDEIYFKLTGESGFISGYIAGFSDTSLVLENGADIPLDQIKRIKIKNGRELFTATAVSGISAIPVFFLYSAANNLFNTGERPLIDKEVYLLSGVFGGISLVSFIFKDKKYNVQNRWHLSVVRM